MIGNFLYLDGSKGPLEIRHFGTIFVPNRKLYFKYWPLENMISFSLFSDQDMYSSENLWTADFGLILDWDNTQRPFQSWVSTLCFILGVSGASAVLYLKKEKNCHCVTSSEMK